MSAPTLHSGRKERMLYSVSRWTDVPGTPSKWNWFMRQFQQGYMVAIDPRTGVPSRWSLDPQEVLGFTFWTRKPALLLQNHARLADYSFHVHFTLTCWTEVEHGAPDPEAGLADLERLVGVFGPERVTWRFSPVPAVPDVVDRFEYVARKASRLGLSNVYVAFLQENDLLPEGRPRRVREEVLRHLAARSHGLRVTLCQEDKTLTAHHSETKAPCPRNLGTGVCEDGGRHLHVLQGGVELPKESCGCALAVDPFTINESCAMGCEYCYAADLSLAPRKRNTTGGFNFRPDLS